MTISVRKYFFDEVTVNENKELDYLNESFTDMKLDSVDSVRISGPFQYRPDLISFKYYNNFDFGWLIALHNNFLDPIYDFKTGEVIKIPDLEQYFRYYKAYTRSD